MLLVTTVPAALLGCAVLTVIVVGLLRYRNYWRSQKAGRDGAIDYLLDERWYMPACAVMLGIATLLLAAGSVIHHTDDERAAKHADETAATVTEFRHAGTPCVAAANEAAAEGRVLLAGSGGTVDDVHDRFVASQINRLNRVYVDNVRCVLDETRRLVPQPRGDVGLVLGWWTDALWCPSSPVPADTATQTLDRLALEEDLWEAHAWHLDEVLAPGTEPDITFEAFRYLTSAARFPDDIGALHPVFSPNGSDDAWVAYNPSDGTFRLNPPTVNQVSAYCSALAEAT